MPTEPPKSYMPAGKTTSTWSTDATVVSIPDDKRFVMFLTGSQKLHLSEIESQMLCNEELFQRMREEYRRAKGWFRSWFGLMKFAHCDFYKVCKLNPCQHLR
jgi:hypothetical protein